MCDKDASIIHGNQTINENNETTLSQIDNLNVV